VEVEKSRSPLRFWRCWVILALVPCLVCLAFQGTAVASSTAEPYDTAYPNGTTEACDVATTTASSTTASEFNAYWGRTGETASQLTYVYVALWCNTDIQNQSEYYSYAPNDASASFESQSAGTLTICGHYDPANDTNCPMDHCDPSGSIAEVTGDMCNMLCQNTAVDGAVADCSQDMSGSGGSCYGGSTCLLTVQAWGSVTAPTESWLSPSGAVVEDASLPPPVAPSIICSDTGNPDTGVYQVSYSTGPLTDESVQSASFSPTLAAGFTDEGLATSENYTYDAVSTPQGGYTAEWSVVFVGDGIDTSGSVSGECTVQVDPLGTVGSAPGTTATGAPSAPVSCSLFDFECDFEYDVDKLFVPDSAFFSDWGSFTSAFTTAVPFSYFAYVFSFFDSLVTTLDGATSTSTCPSPFPNGVGYPNTSTVSCEPVAGLHTLVVIMVDVAFYGWVSLEVYKRIMNYVKAGEAK